MYLKDLEISWKCGHKKHNCLAIENLGNLIAKDIMIFAIKNNAFCVNEKGPIESMFFIEINGKQKMLKHGELLYELELEEKRRKKKS